MNHKVIMGAVAHFGTDAQLLKLVEEAAELIQAVMHYRDGKVTAEQVADEVADMKIMVAQAEIILGDDVVGRCVRKKLKRLEEMMDGAG